MTLDRVNHWITHIPPDQRTGKILSPLVERLEDTFVENSADFLWKMNRVTLDRQEKMVSFDVVSLFTKDNTDSLAILYYP